MAQVEQIGAGARVAAERLARSVVRLGGGWRGGMGFVVADGLVLTNAHNVRGDRLGVAFADGRTAEATAKGVDIDGDLAVLAVDTSGAPAVEWSTTAEPSIGTPAYAVTLNGQGRPRATVGWISSVALPFRGPRGRRIAGALEHTAPLASGSSGSPLADGEGRVIGINTNRVGSGFYLALPVDAVLRERIDRLARGETPRRPRLGVALAPSFAARRMRRAVGLPERDGLLVREVEQDSPASRAGISASDLIVSANGRPLADADDLYDVMGSVGDDATLEVVLLRGADERTLSVELGEN